MCPGRSIPPLEPPSTASIRIGRPVIHHARARNCPSMVPGKGWDLPTGDYTPQQIVEANAPLLESCVYHLATLSGDVAMARELLLDSLASTLSLGTPEASMRLPVEDPTRVEVAKQALRIGRAMVEYARAVADAPYDPGYTVRGTGEGHRLKPGLAQIMYGCGSQVVHVFNEYLHQMVLLRDALIPFENFDDVVIPIEAKYRRKRGMGHMEEIRAKFLREIVKKHVTQASVVRVAQCLLTPRLRANKDVFGFQYQLGTVLPSFVVGGTSLRLLRYVPAILDPARDQIAFQHRAHDCYVAPGSNIARVGADSALCSTQQAELTLSATEKAALSAIELTLQACDGSRVRIDLGQVACGRRCAYTIRDAFGGVYAPVAPPPSLPPGKTPGAYSAWQVLSSSEPGLVSATAGLHHIVAHNNVELLALLGKLYPKNVVVMKKGQSFEQVEEAARSLPAGGRFIIELME